MSVDVSVIILTFNEEDNIAQALDSVCGWAARVFILDSHSTDGTLEIAGRYGCTIRQRPFDNYAAQRNYALEHLPVRTGWAFFLDADEWLPEDLKTEIADLIASGPEEDGFYVKRRLMWMGRWVRRGYYPTWILRLFRHGRARCEAREINEHLVVEGRTGRLRCDFIHEDRKGVADWVAKHNRYAGREAAELLNNHGGAGYLGLRFWGTQAERKRWLRYRVWNKLPPLLRPFIYFFYRYVLAGGFLDGKAGLVFHFLQGLWYPFLIDVRYIELKLKR